MKIGDVVAAVWDDHSFDFGALDNPKILQMTTVGFLALEAEGFVCIAQTRREDGELNEIMTIDRRMLLSLNPVSKQVSRISSPDMSVCPGDSPCCHPLTCKELEN